MSLAENWCQTKFTISRANLEWRIHLPFQKSIPSWFSIESARFSAKEARSIVWYITFRGEKSENPTSQVVFQLKRAGRGIPINAEACAYYIAKLAIINKRNEKIFTTFENDRCAFDLEDPLYKDVIINDNLNVYCEIAQVHKETVSANAGNTKRANVLNPFSDGGNVLQSHLETLFENAMLSDVNFDVNGREFKAHKAILASRSEVFASMFKHATTENITNRVVIKDIDPDVFQQLLRFIYTGRLSTATMDAMASELLAAADKYLLDQLNSECENHLMFQMSADNCLAVLLLQDENHPAYGLRKEAAEFFRLHPDKVMATSRWKEAKQENPVLLCDIQEFVYTPLQ